MSNIEKFENKIGLASRSTDIIKNPGESLVAENRGVLQEIMPAMNLPSDLSVMLFLKALYRFKITEREFNEAFWKSYADKFVPKDGIEFRHIWDHVEKMRKGEGRRTYTHDQVLRKMHKDNIPMDAFELIVDSDERGRRLWVLK